MDRVKRLLVIIGGGALLTAMAVDTLAVFGRHAGLPLLGSIEIIQAAVLVAGSLAMLMATLAGHHAMVRLVLDRAGGRGRQLMQRISALLAALFFMALLAGSVWLAIDLWSGHEHSELLRIPYRPLRLAAITALFAIMLVFLRRLVNGDRE